MRDGKGVNEAVWKYLDTGRALANEGKLTEAIALYQQAVAELPDRSELYRELGVLQEKIGDQAGEIASYQRAIELDPRQPIWVYSTLGHLLAEQQQWSGVIEIYRQGLEQYPEQSSFYRQLGFAQEKVGAVIAEIANYRKAIELESQPQWVYETLVNLLVSQADLAQAIIIARKGLEVYPEQAQLQKKLLSLQQNLPQAAEVAVPTQERLNWYLEQAKQQSDQGQHQAAIDCYESAITAFPESAALYQAYGVALEQVADYSGVIRCYGKAIELDSQQPSWVYLVLGKLLRENNQLEPSHQIYQTARVLYPDQAEIYRELGIVQENLGDFEAEVISYQTAIRLQPNQPDWVYLTLVKLLCEQGQFEAAAAYCHQAIQQWPDRVQYWISLAGLLNQQSRWSEAKACYRQAIGLRPQDPEILTKVAEGLERQFAWSEAIICYQKLLKLQPQNHPLVHQIEMLRSHQQTKLEVAPLIPAILADQEQVAQIITESGLFDEQYYLSQYSEVGTGAISALQHYIEFGAAQGYNPNPFFDSRYYLDHYPEVAQAKLNPLAHYLYCGAAEQRNPHPLFDTAFYLSHHPDVANSGINPLVHYYFYGLAEGRVALSFSQIRSLIQVSAQDAEDAPYLKGLNPSEPDLPTSVPIKIGVYCNTLGNYFMAEIADLIAAALTQLGMTVMRLCETDRRPANLDLEIVVAPHEFFYLGSALDWNSASRVKQAIMVNVEQPHTPWFAKAFHFLRQARLVLDINVKSAAILERLGVPAYFLPLGYLPDYLPFGYQDLPELRVLQGLPRAVYEAAPDLQAPLASRPIDLQFVGTMTDRRSQFFAQNATWLSRFHSFLHIPPIERPFIQGQGQSLNTEAMVAISQRSKILLNLHREEIPYFEWHRMVLHGLWQNTLVLTEPCHAVPGLVAGAHFIECNLEQMGKQVDWLLNTDSGRAEAERIRRAGHQQLKNHLSLLPIMGQILTLWLEIAA